MKSASYLLDTHCLIWFLGGNENKIPSSVNELIRNSANTIFFSQISLFEITIKQKIGKLPDFASTVADVHSNAIDTGFSFLNIQNEHLFQYENIPLHEAHRDPFDRLLIATALHEKAIILTADKSFMLYANQVKVLW
jgi:PIN domain nuclease of toxin-antitoxin system